MLNPVPQRPGPSGAETAAMCSPTILLVDDDDITRASMAARLKRLGYRVVEADDGHAGLSAIRTHRPDLIILDWMMPGLDGPSVCEAIRADAELKSSHILLMTAHDRPDQIAEGLSVVREKTYSCKRILLRIENRQQSIQTREGKNVTNVTFGTRQADRSM